MKIPFYSFVLALSVATTALADDLNSLAGKWSVKKANPEGQNVTQTIEVKKDKFTRDVVSDAFESMVRANLIKP